MKHHTPLGMLLIAACSSTPLTTHDVCLIKKPLSVAPQWLLDDRDILVCWAEEAGYDKEKDLVYHKIQESWAVALQDPNVPAFDHYLFTGWLPCSETEFWDISVSLDNQYSGGLAIWRGTHVDLIIGTKALDLDTAWKEFLTEQEWATAQFNAERLVGRITMHEFGHALGFVHEHERTDAHDCGSKKDSEDTSNVYYGEFDSQSVMSYCGNWDSLSEGDIRWARYVYYPSYYQSLPECPTT